MPLKVGLAGGGGIATPHLEAFVRNEHVGEVILAEPHEEARQRQVERFGIIKHATADFDDLVADDSVDVIDLCTPHDLHHPQAVAALDAGKHVITEKPIAITLDQADEMIARAKKAGKRLFVALCQRMFPAHIRARQIIDDGEIGDLYMGVVTVIGDEFGRMNDPKSWKGDWDRAGGGALIDTGYHAVYMMQHFLGPAQAVTARMKRLRVKPKNKADDTAFVALEHPKGRMSTITVTYAATGSPWVEERRLVGTTGELVVREGVAAPGGGEHGILDDLEYEVPLLGFADKQPVYPPPKVFNPPRVNWYAIGETIHHFIECLVEEKEEDITAGEARAALATCLAAYQSDREGRRVEIDHVKQ
jgi:UDP-N-acetylglucosamine 3-dehydrogenase